MAFDEATAYRNEYQWVGRVIDAVWEYTAFEDTIRVDGLKARFGPINTPDLISLAAGLGLTTEAAAVVVWEPKPSDVEVEDWEPVFDPRPGHILRRDMPVTEEGQVAEGWLIKSASRSTGRGKWFLLVDKEATNA